MATVLLVALICIGTTSYVLSQSSSQTITIEPPSFTETASYIIFKVGNTIYAKNGTTGEIEFSGTDASQVIQSAIDALPKETGGKIFIKAGTYVISSYLSAVNNLVLEGEGKYKTILKMADGANLIWGILRIYSVDNVTVKNLGFDGNQAQQTDDTPNVVIRNANNILIENCYFYNARYHSLMLYAPSEHPVSNVEIVQNYFYNNGKAAIDLSGDAGVTKVIINNNIISHSNGRNQEHVGAINIGSGSSSVMVEGNLIYNTQYVHDTVADIRVADAATNVIVDGNVLVNGSGQGIWVVGCEKIVVSNNAIYNNSQSGIYIEKSPRVIVDGNLIYRPLEHGITIVAYGGVFSHESKVIGNTIIEPAWHGIAVDSNYVICAYNTIKNPGYGSGANSYDGILFYGDYGQIYGNIIYDDQETHTMRCGINEYISSGTKGDYNRISNNRIIGASTIAINVTGEHTVVINNDGFTTENSGTATISASTSVTFEHGLAGTPTHVEIGWKDTGYGDWKWTANATHITITVTNSGTYSFSWRAYYKP